MDLLKPTYNIFPIAGSPYGFKHSKETKEKLKLLGLSQKNLKHLKIINSRLRYDPTWKDNHLKALKKLHINPESRAKRSETLKKII